MMATVGSYWYCEGVADREAGETHRQPTAANYQKLGTITLHEAQARYRAGRKEESQ